MKNKFSVSLTSKFIAFLALCLILVFGVMVQVNLNNLKGISISRGEVEALNSGEQFGQTFGSKLNGLKQELEMLSRVLLQSSQTGSLPRDEVIGLLKDTLAASPDILGVYTLWEPNAFDGKDKEWVSRTAHDDGTGRFIPYVARSGADIIVEPLKGYDKEGDGDYYQIPKKTRKIAILEPYAYEVGNQTVQITSVVVPILDADQRFKGIVGIDFALDSLQKEATGYTPLGGYITMISHQGNYLANPAQPELVAKPYADNEEKKALFAKVAAGEATEGYTSDPSGGTVLRMFLPIRLAGSDDAMYAEAVIPEKQIMATYREGRSEMLLVSALGLIVLGLVIAVLTRILIIRRLKMLATSVNLMAGGDLTQKVELRSKDELGQLGADFNRMSDELRGMFHLVGDLSMSVGATSQQLTASAEQTSLASETIARSIEEVAAGSDAQNRHTRETANALAEISLGIERIANSSSAVSASAQEVQSQTELGNSRIAEAGEQMARVKDTVAETERVMAELQERSQEIGGIVAMISEISSQTNLLALNAAIEAARAGEHGRGFAVVASEVRKLADQTLKAAEQVSGMIHAVQQDTVRASDRMRQGAVEVEAGERIVLDCAKLFKSVGEEMQRVNGEIQEVSATSEQMNAGSQQVSASIEELARLAGEASDSSQNVASASEEQLASMEEIASSAAALSAMVQELLEKLSRFKI
ncbi:methyl-accepting chemotaxis protein [Cohnella boryungensis]|uniref:Methyl-accepting chemotaxis protein n=1 Tax=Cohnella boryungensis TaxID=768479 RepID=A0ABV8SBU5_9BACL